MIFFVLPKNLQH